jgi:hypothetical protein
MLGSMEAWTSSPAAFAPGFSIPGVKADFARLGINSPEELFVRQLASQRTAFAITGPGAVQSDLFPVLEYAAPFAFYLGENSTVLEKYDQRTRQQLLAPAEQNTMLRSLKPEEIRSVFSKYATVNSELIPAIRNLRDGENIPCVLNPAAPRVNALPVLGTNVDALSQAASTFGAGTPAQTMQAIAVIEAELGRQPPGTNGIAAQWASLAATAALGANNPQRAAQLAVTALKFDPDDPQAAFLLRILAREAPALFQK